MNEQRIVTARWEFIPNYFHHISTIGSHALFCWLQLSVLSDSARFLVPMDLMGLSEAVLTLIRAAGGVYDFRNFEEV